MPPAAPATIRFTPVADEPTSEALDLCDGGEVLTVKEACARLKVSRPTLYKAMDSGALAYCQDGPGCRRTITKRAIQVYQARRLKR